MEINNTFDVPLPPKDAWKVLLDIERIAPCMPGAELTGKADSDTYNGKVAVRLGPVALSRLTSRTSRRAQKRRARIPRAAAAPMPRWTSISWPSPAARKSS
jgi:carbon monoxide dehydrogenase subunit G